MKIINKKNWLLKGLFLVSILFLSIFVLTSCGGDEDEEKPVDTSIPTSLIASQNEVEMYVGDTTTISISAIPSTASNEVTWTVDNQEVVSVSNGVVTAQKVGTANVTATSIKNSNIKVSIQITVVGERTFDVQALPENLCVNQTFKLEVIGNVGNVTFTSQYENVATVDENGVVTGVSGGNATITIKSVDYTNIIKHFNFKVYNIPTSLSTANKKYEIFIDETTKFNLKAQPSNSLTAVTWESSNPQVATIDENGVLTGISAGSTTIKATSVVNSNVTFEREIIVKAPAEKVTITTDDSTSAFVGETIQLHATVEPSTVDGAVTWRSSDSNIATVDENGLVTITGLGEAYIFASSVVTTHISDKIKITGLHDLLDNDSAEVKYILCAPGTDASTSISINYHAKNTRTYIEYTLASDVDFMNASSYIPEGRYFEEIDEALAAPFEARNIYSAEITGLIPGTEYIYRINNGDGTYSDTYHFTTAKGSGNFSFIWLTDNHYHYLQGEETTGPEISEQTIAKAMGMRPDLAFVLDTGDMIDTGGNSNIWDLMFRKRTSLKLLPMVSTTGNHELYVDGTQIWDNRFHAAYNALPKNGVEEKLGTSCYFIYNDVLFILIENMNNSGYDKQLAWMEQLFIDARINGKAKYIICGMHGPIQEEGNSDRDEKMMSLFDKYSVDLVLTGHYHYDNEVRDYYEGKPSSNPLLGVNYLIGDVSGAKGLPANADPGAFARGYVIDVNEDGISVTHIDANGKVYYTRTYTTKTDEEVSEEAKNTSKEDIMNSFDHTLNTSTNEITFTWSNNAYGNVTQIIIEETFRKEESNNAYILNPAYTKLTLSNALNYYDSNYKVTVYFNDGTTLQKDILVKRGQEINLHATNITDTSTTLKFDTLNNAIQFVVKKIAIYINGELYTTTDYMKNSVPVTEILLTGLTSKTEYEVKFVTLTSSGNVVFEHNITFVTE